jgi:hypothetical protein
MNLEQVKYYNQFDTSTGRVYYIQNERIDELNERMVERQFPDKPLEPNYDPRPVPTKYSRFPIIDRRKPIKEALKHYDDYEVEKNFAPMTFDGPVSAYMNNIDTETSLRNQFFALQRDSVQGTYIPSRDSELYNVTIVSKPSEQPFKDLFSYGTFDQNPNPNVAGNPPIGKEKFFNHTRTQLRNMV